MLRVPRVPAEAAAGVQLLLGAFVGADLDDELSAFRPLALGLTSLAALKVRARHRQQPNRLTQKMINPSCSSFVNNHR